MTEKTAKQSTSAIFLQWDYLFNATGISLNFSYVIVRNALFEWANFFEDTNVTTCLWNKLQVRNNLKKSELYFKSIYCIVVLSLDYFIKIC